MKVPISIVLAVIIFGLGMITGITVTVETANELAAEDAGVKIESTEALFRVAVRHLGPEQLEVELLHELNEFPNRAKNTLINYGGAR